MTPVATALPDPRTEPVLTAKRAAAILRVCPRHVYMSVERGDIPAIRVGKSVRIPTAQFLEKFGFAEQAQAATA